MNPVLAKKSVVPSPSEKRKVAQLLMTGIPILVANVAPGENKTYRYDDIA
jgi:hypothetical protein